MQQLNDAARIARSYRHRPSAPDMAVVIDGRALSVALEGDAKERFLELGMACKVRSWTFNNCFTILVPACDAPLTKLRLT